VCKREYPPFSDDSAILSTAPVYVHAVDQLQQTTNRLISWAKNWKIAINNAKSVHVDFALRPHHYQPLYDNGRLIPNSVGARYLGMYLDQRLTYKLHISTKRIELDLRFRKLYWLLGPHSQLSLENKRLIYITVLRPVWSYSLQL